MELEAIHATTPAAGILHNKIVSRWWEVCLQVGRVDETWFEQEQPRCSVEWLKVESEGKTFTLAETEDAQAASTTGGMGVYKTTSTKTLASRFPRHSTYRSM